MRRETIEELSEGKPLQVNGYWIKRGVEMVHICNEEGDLFHMAETFDEAIEWAEKH